MRNGVITLIGALSVATPLGGCADNGQTGSIGPIECEGADGCDSHRDRIEGALSALELDVAVPFERTLLEPQCLTPEELEGRDLGKVACEPVCLCPFEDEYGDWIPVVLSRPLPLGPPDQCQLPGRSGNCLAYEAEFAGCEPDDATSCHAACEAADGLLREDGARVFDAEVRSTWCAEPSCRSIVRVEDRCYLDMILGPGMEQDCSLSDAEILELTSAPAQDDELGWSDLCE